MEVEKNKTNMMMIQEIWKDRLDDLGGRVADALIEMGDLQGAARYLESWRAGMMIGKVSEDGDREAQKMKEGKIKRRLTLLYLRIGKVEAARECIMNE